MSEKNALWLQYIPRRLRDRVQDRYSLQKIISNTCWLFGDKILRMGFGLLVGVWVARYLGPAQFGIVNFATAFITLFSVIGTLGLNEIVVRDLVKEPQNANVTLGTAFFMQVLGGLLAYVLSVIAIGYVRPDDNVVKLIVVVMGFITVLKSTEVVKYWFESQVQSKYLVWVENTVFLLFVIVKVALILHHATLFMFVWATLAESVMVAACLLGMYAWRVAKLRAWSIQLRRAYTLLKDSWPLILSGLAIMIYMRIDQIMLGQMIGDEAVGIYSAAVRISEVWYFIPMAIVSSVFPSILDAKRQSELLYYARLQKLYNLMVMFGLLVAIPMTLLSSWLAVFLFGQDYEQTGNVLAIHIWTGIFVFLGVASGKWYLIENLQIYAFYRTGYGMLINLIANFILIPKYGTTGAAIGTLISQICAAYIFDFFCKETRQSFYIKSASIFSFVVIARRMARNVGIVS